MNFNDYLNNVANAYQRSFLWLLTEQPTQGHWDALMERMPMF